MKIKNKGFIKHIVLLVATIGFIGFFAVGSTQAQGIEPIFNPRYLNLDFLFYNLVQILKAIWLFLTEGPLKSIFQAILAVISVFLIAVISYILIRLNEMDKKQKKKVDKTIPGHMTSDEV
ncbi:MAG: hypothetical protein KA007_00770, partial [Candidatus Pacebacteria bacterium]|nr:hypothetical protein [Candidatus Paceibacterota bacterium]